MFTKEQLQIISDAIEEYAFLQEEDIADECGIIVDIINAHNGLET